MNWERRGCEWIQWHQNNQYRNETRSFLHSFTPSSICNAGNKKWSNPVPGGTRNLHVPPHALSGNKFGYLIMRAQNRVRNTPRMGGN